MKVPFNDLKLHHTKIHQQLNESFLDVVGSADFIKGNRLMEFENAYARFVNIPFCKGTSNGTSALILALKATGVQPNDEIIVPSHTFIATAEAVVNVGAIPVFVDIDPQTYLITPEIVEKSITKQTKAIIVVHIYGQMCDMEAFKKLAEKNNLVLIEDAAQAHGSLWNKHAPGHYSDIATVSFYPGKNLGALGDAGCILTNRKEIANLVEMLADHGRDRVSKYEHQMIGSNERMDTLQASFLLTKLPYLTQWIAARRKLASRYDSELGNLVGIPYVNPNANHSYHLYVIRISQREQLYNHLKNDGIMCGIHYPIPLHKQVPFLSSSISLPQTENAAKNILSLPLYPEMTEEQQTFVIDSIKKFYS